MRIASTKHGLSGSPTRKTWECMVRRCTCPGDKDYPSYGARGITVAPRWMCFTAFVEDMGTRPPGTTLGRINNDLGYWPDNCRWETAEQQCSNRRSTVTITANGETLTLAQWARRLGTSREAIRYRLRAGWTPEQIVDPNFDRKLRRKSC